MEGLHADGDHDAVSSRYAQCPVTENSPFTVSIMPPGTVHCVFNPVPSLCQGGHFYTYDTMPATRQACEMDMAQDLATTNDGHPGAVYVLYRMAASLVEGGSRVEAQGKWHRQVARGRLLTTSDYSSSRSGFRHLQTGP